MTSILEPFLSKRNPNETGTVSVYANVNNKGGEGTNIVSEGITSSDGTLSLKFVETDRGYNLELVDNSTSSTLFIIDELGNIILKGDLSLSNGDTAVNRIVTSLIKPGNNNTIATTKAIIDALDLKLNQDQVVEEYGTSSLNTLSQKFITDELNAKASQYQATLISDSILDKVDRDEIINEFTEPSLTTVYNSLAVHDMIDNIGAVAGRNFTTFLNNPVSLPQTLSFRYHPLRVYSEIGAATIVDGDRNYTYVGKLTIGINIVPISPPRDVIEWAKFITNNIDLIASEVSVNDPPSTGKNMFIGRPTGYRFTGRYDNGIVYGVNFNFDIVVSGLNRKMLTLYYFIRSKTGEEITLPMTQWSGMYQVDGSCISFCTNPQ